MSASTLAAAQFPGRSGGINAPAALGAGALLLAGAAAIDQAVSPRQVALYLLGAALGLVLYHAAFGFTSAWRIFIADRRGEGLRAQMVMLAVAVVLFFPVLAAGTLFGQPAQGFVSPSAFRWCSAPSSSASASCSARCWPRRSPAGSRRTGGCRCVRPWLRWRAG